MRERRSEEIAAEADECAGDGCDGVEDGGGGGRGGRADGAEVVGEEGEDEGEVGLAEGGGLEKV